MMERYQLEDTKRSVDYLLDEINKSLDMLQNYSVDVGMDAYVSGVHLNDIKTKLYEFYESFTRACGEAKERIDMEEQEEK